MIFLHVSDVGVKRFFEFQWSTILLLKKYIFLHLIWIFLYNSYCVLFVHLHPIWKIILCPLDIYHSQSWMQQTQQFCIKVKTAVSWVKTGADSRWLIATKTSANTIKLEDWIAAGLYQPYKSEHLMAHTQVHHCTLGQPTGGTLVLLLLLLLYILLAYIKLSQILINRWWPCHFWSTPNISNTTTSRSPCSSY